ncbi:MAG: aminoglycoside phosphotransferase family protein [Gorillibacterium sp.]|nr:aminoglycoside phosphotransferase family protein [Gorillibacterium sp.]
MESFNKSKLTEAELQVIVQHAFKQTYQSAVELTEGWANIAYILKLEDGRKVVLKVAPSKDKPLMRCEKDNMRTEVEAIRLLEDKGGLPIPHVYIYDSECTLISSEYFIMSFIEGTPLVKAKESLTKEQLDQIHRQLGQYNRQINDCIGDKFGYFHAETGLKETWSEAFRDLIFGVLTDGKEAGVQLPVPYLEIEQEIEKRMSALDEVKEAHLVHWDLWDGNIIIHEGQIAGIIDFERAIWGDPLIEYYFGHFSQSAAFDEGYGRASVTKAERTRRALYDLYLDLILVIECEYRQYENQDHVKWTFVNFQQGYERFLKS